MSVRVRFAPSPTGYLHIGSARTALFNYLFARHHNGKFLLRIEDTDRERSTVQAVDAIFKSLDWLGLKADEEVVFQFERAGRHAEVANELLKQGKAYYCYCSPEELQAMRDTAIANKQTPKYNGYWRDRDISEAPEGVKPVIRLKMPQTGSVKINDLVQGEVTVENAQLDDMVLLRADGTPTYMLSVVVDDHDMGITHIIRGDDHLTNMFRQYQIYAAMEWQVPEFAHIPLIHGSDGAKLSKRHGATSADMYQEMGFLPWAMNNYLMRLGWGHGDSEIISYKQAIDWFSLSGIGRSPARFDMAKLTNLNGHYIREADNQYLLAQVLPFLEKNLGQSVEPLYANYILKGMQGLKERSKTLIELADGAMIYIKPFEMDEKAKAVLSVENIEVLKAIYAELKLAEFSHDNLEMVLRKLAEKLSLNLGKLAAPLRVAITGRTVSPSLFEIMEILGKTEIIKRLELHLK
jgi:glutamyl-tRNA synthetase